MKKEQTKKQLEELKLGWQRTQADFENYKKRVESEKIGWRDDAKIEVIENLLPVLDNLSLAVKHAPASDKNTQWLQGLLLILKQIDEKLFELGVEKISPQVSDKFDHNLHEAVECLPSDNCKSGTISQLKSEGYKIGPCVIRPAKVTVAK